MCDCCHYLEKVESVGSHSAFTRQPEADFIPVVRPLLQVPVNHGRRRRERAAWDGEFHCDRFGRRGWIREMRNRRALQENRPPHRHFPVILSLNPHSVLQRILFEGKSCVSVCACEWVCERERGDQWPPQQRWLLGVGRRTIRISINQFWNIHMLYCIWKVKNECHLCINAFHSLSSKNNYFSQIMNILSKWHNPCNLLYIYSVK